MVESLQQSLHFLFNVKGLIEWGGTLLVCVIVFIETGFFVGFFLPGDSLLVTAGVFAASGQLHIGELVLLVPICAIVGDQIGYWIGRKARPGALPARGFPLSSARATCTGPTRFTKNMAGKP